MENKFKRFLSLTLALLMIIGMVPVSASAAEFSGGTKLYLTPNSNWKVDNARFAIYVFGNTGDGWASMSDTDGDGIYEATVPDGTWTNVIFCRMNPTQTANNWDNKWNQSSDLVYDGNKNHYTVSEGAWDKGAGTWSHKHVPGEDATCTTNQVCTVCDTVLVWGGHKWVIGDESVCSVCQKVCKHLDKGEHGTCADCKICLHKEHDVNGKCYCGLELGAAAHQWGMPGTCDVCGATHETHGGEWTWEVPGEDYGSRRCSICGTYHYHVAWDEYFMCTECGAPCQHYSYTEDGKCTSCGYCRHDAHDTDGKCVACGGDVNHHYVNNGDGEGLCVCGAKCPHEIWREDNTCDSCGVYKPDDEGEAEACEHDWGNDNDGICNLCQAECKHPEHSSELYPYCTTCRKGLEHSYGEDNNCVCGSKAVAQMLKDGVLSKSADVFHLLANSGGTATVTLLADAAVEMEQTLTVSGTLDLNGHTLTANMVIGYGANFTIQDNSEAKNGKIVGNINVKKTNYSVGVLRLESGAIEGNITVENGWLYISGGHVDGKIVKAYDGGVLEITGGTFTSEPSVDFLKQADGSCNGYKAVKDEATGIWTVVEKQAPVASINGSVWFETLQAAIDAAVDGDYIWLERDVTLAQNTGLTVDNKKITLDLQGNTISSNINGEEICGTIRIGKNGDLTIKGNDNGAVKNEAEMTDDGYSSIALLNYGKLTVEGGTFVGGNALYNGSYGYADTEAVLKGGSFESTDIYEVSVANCANLTVEGATIKNWLSTSGKLEVKSGEIENLSVTNADAAVASGIGTTISGGYIQLLDMTSLSNGKYANAVTVTDGSVNAVEVYVQDGATVKATLAISEGYHGAIACYTYDENYEVTESDENLGVAISGGRFTADPSAYVAGGYKATMSEYGYWEIVEKLPAVAAVNGVEYETLQAAINAVRTDAGPLDHDTVTLLQNVTEIVNIHEKYLTLDLNGFTLSGNPSAGQGVINVSGMGTQVITNGTIQNTGTEGVGLLLDDPVASSDYVALKDVSIEGVEYGIYTKRHTQNTDGSLTLRATADNGIAFYGTYRGTLVTWGSDNTLVEGNAYAIKIEDYTPQDPQMKGGILCGTFRGSIEIPKDYFAIRGGSFTEDPSGCLSEGYVANLVDGMYVVAKEEVTYVAQIVNGESYETLQAAIEAAVDNDTIILLSDIALSESINIYKNITLDLGGKTITGNEIFGLYADVNLTNGAITSDGMALRISNGDVTLSDIEVTSVNERAIYADGGYAVTKVTLQSGTKIISDNGTALHIFGDTAELVVQSGAIIQANMTNYGYGLTINNGATATIAAGAEIYGDRALDVSDATVITSADITGSNAAITVTNAKNATTLRIEGGIVQADTFAMYGYGYSGDDYIDANIYVTDGAFSGSIHIEENAPVILSISGGTFSHKNGYAVESKYLAEGYVLAKQEDKYIVIKESETLESSVAQLGEVRYDSLEEAISQAYNGVTVTLLKDIVTNKVVMNQSMTLDLNGHTISGYSVDGGYTDGLVEITGDDVLVTITNGSIEYVKNENTEKTWGSGICVAWGANVTLSNVKVSSMIGCATEVNQATLTLASGTELTATAEDGRAVWISEATLNVNDGTSVSGATSFYCCFDYEIIVSGGMIAGAMVFEYENEGTVTVSGGTFTHNPSDFLAEGYVANLVDDKYVVVEGEAEEPEVTYVAQIVGGESYETLQAAINAAEKGAEILLLTDVSENVTANKVLRLTPNGFTFSGEISAEGFRVYHWVEGRMWLVLPGDSVVFEVLSGYKGYPSVQAAVDASEGVCILNLIQDVNEVVTVGEGVILGGLSLNGFTLSGAPTSKDQGVLNINGNVGGSINNGSIINTGTMGAAIVLNNTSNSSGEDLNGVQGDVNIQGVDAGIITNTRVGFWRNIHVSATAENGIGVLVKQGGSLITYNHNGCSITGKGAAVKVENGTYENPSFIEGGTIDGALSFGEGATVNVVGGTYTVDPSAYVAEGYVATYDAANKWYTVSQKQVVEDVKPEELPDVTVEDKNVSVSVSGTESKTEIKEEVKTELENSGVNNETIQQAANNTQTATSLVQAAAKAEAVQSEVSKVVEEKKAIIEEVFEEDEEVEVEVRPYLDMTITDFKPAEETGTATLKLSIEAKYDVVAVGEKKEAVLETGKTMETVQKDITITIPLPEGFVTEGKVLKIKHSKNGVQKGIYDAEVSADGKTATFVNPNGFSEFEAYTEDAPSVTGVAKIGNQSYDTLQAAIDAVKNGETIELLQNVTENVTLTQKTGLSYTVDGNNKTLTGKIVIKTDSTQSESKRTVIKNLNFVSDAKVDFINSTETNYYPVITVEGCTFTGNGKGEAVAIRLKSSQSVIIKDCVGTGLHSFLQNTSGWDMTIENVTVTNSKSGFAMGTAQNSLVKDCKITASDVGYGIRYDAGNETTNTVRDCEVTAFIPVVIRKASVNNTIVIEGTNKLTAKNTDGLWVAMGTSEYEENGTMPTDATGRIILTVNDAELNQNEAGVYGHEAHIGNKFYTAKPEGTLAVGVVTDDAAKANDSFIYFDIKNLTAYESIEIKLYSGDTLLSSTKLNDAGIGKGYLALGALSANIELTKNSSSWDTTWAVAPRYDLVPNKAVLYIDGIEQNTVNEIRMYNTDNPALKREWIDVEGVGFIEVDNTDGTETWHGTLADALSAAKDGAVVTLHDVDKVIDANGEVTGGKTVTITGKATFNWQAGWLFVGRGNNPGDGKLIFDNATITSSEKKNPATYGVYVSGAKADGSTANGAVVIKNSSIELDYLRNQNTVEIDNSTLTVYGGFSISGRKSSEAAGGVDATATIDIKNGSTVNVLNENGMGIGYEGNGVVILKDSTFKSKSITLYGDGGKSYFDVYGKSTIDVKFNSKETKAVNYGLVYLNGVDFDANTKITGKVRVRAASGTNNIDGSTIDAPFFQVGIGAYNGQDPKVDTVNGVTVNVKNNAVISAGGSTYAGWVGTGYYDTDAEKVAAMTDAKYVLNIENSQASFGYLHVSNDGVVNVIGHTDNKYKSDGSTVDFYAGDFIINGVATFDNTDSWVKYTKVSCDNGTDKPGTLIVKNGAKAEMSIHNGGESSTALLLYKTGIVEFNGATVEIDNKTSIAANAKLNVTNTTVTALGTVTNKGAIAMDRTSLLKAPKLVNTGAITIDASGLAERVVIKVIDLRGTESLEGKVTVNNLGDGTVEYGNDGDVTLCGPVYVAQIGEKKYTSLEAAFDAAQENETVTLLDNLEIASQLIIDKAVTLDGAGFAIKALPFTGKFGEYNNYMIDVRADATIKNLIVDGSLVDPAVKLYGIQFYGCKATLDNVAVKAIDNYYPVHLNGAEVEIVNKLDLSGCKKDGYYAAIGLSYGEQQADANGNLPVCELTVGQAELVGVECVIVDVSDNKQNGSIIVNKLPATVPVMGAVAELNGIYYGSLNDAVAAAQDNDTIKVLANATVTSGIVIEDKAVTVTAENAVTLTTNGVTDVFTVGAGGKLTLGENLTVNSNTSILWAKDGGEITVDGAILNGTGATYATAFADAGSTITITSGSIHSEGNSALAAENAGAVVNIKGGTVSTNATAAKAAAYAQAGGEVIVDGGTVESKNAAAESAALVAGNGGTVTVKSGTVIGAKYAVVAHEASTAKAIIEGGTIDGLVYEEDGADVAISGGSFDRVVPVECCEIGYNPVTEPDANGRYTVTLGFVLNVDTNVNYGSIAQALAATKDGETLKLLQDVSESMVMVNRGITLDLNGNTLDADYLVVFNGSSLVDNSTEKGLLKIDKDNISLPVNNAQMPVWNEVDGYHFIPVNVEQKSLSTPADVLFQVKFLPGFGALEGTTTVASKYLANGAENNGLQFMIRMSWEKDGTEVYQTFVFNEDLVKQVYGAGKAFSLKVTSIGSIESVKIQIIVVSNTGVQAVSQPMNYSCN